MTNIYLNQLGIVCALGADRDSVAAALFAADAPQGLSTDTALIPGRTLTVGRVNAELPDLCSLPVALQGRNNALLALALQQIQEPVDAAIARFGAHRVAVVIGTSTSGVAEAEEAHRRRLLSGSSDWPPEFDYAQQEMGTPADFLASQIGSCGPAYVISTACSSSAKAIAAAARLLRGGSVDAVVAGGADSLCSFTVAGFSALGAISDVRCNPFSHNRRGINIGEGAALFLLTREQESADEKPSVRLLGWGESADAHHMSAPDPSGAGPESAIRQALQRANLAAEQIDYLNLHGTATAQNDAMEAAVVQRVFGSEIPVSSTKPLTGHTLGAAGAIEAALCWLSLRHNPQSILPPHWWDGAADPELAALNLVAPGTRATRPLRYLLSQSFAFGGSNAALILGRDR